MTPKPLDTLRRGSHYLLMLPALLLGSALPTMAGDADLVLPDAAARAAAHFNLFGATVSGDAILTAGIFVTVLGALFGLWGYKSLKALPAHKSMLDVSELIYGTCKTYLFQQGKLLLMLFLLIGATMVFYFGYLKGFSAGNVILILALSLIGVAGSFAVAWFGILINNLANSRMAFAALRGKPMELSEIPTRSGMCIGMLLISVELILMISVLKFVPAAYAGFAFLGFAIGESLGASVLRICGGIFTKIADVGSDMMKIVFGIKEDDARNPGVIADCAGDNAGDSVGPTADGFETYGVTGVALITFILMAVPAPFQWTLIVWIFTMRIAMVIVSLLGWVINTYFARAMWGSHKKFNFEHPLTSLIWVTSLLCIATTYVVTYSMLGTDTTVYTVAGLDIRFADIWWKLASIISFGTIAAAIIPELTRVFTSTSSAHTREIVDATKEGGAGLTILSGLVAGNFSAFWMGLTVLGLMLGAFLTGTSGSGTDLFTAMMGGYPAVFAFGLVAFGMLGMGPTTIAVDSYGPVTDNAQSVFELSTIETIPNIAAEVEKDFGFKPDFETGKLFLEENDGAGNTFKATAKPMLIGTAVVGSTTMIFSLILLLKDNYHWANLEELSIVQPWVLLGLLAGGSVIYWFTGASMQAVTTGAYRAVDFIKKNIKLSDTEKASKEDSNAVVRICTVYAQYGMINIFVVIFTFALAFACVDPKFFAAYLISIALFGLFQAIFMANAGGAWDNAKKVVETELRQKGTELHDATVIGDLVGDPFKDTSSVALNPIIKFTTLFGLLAVEIAIKVPEDQSFYKYIAAGVFFLIGLFFVWRSFYQMRISTKH